MYPPCTVSLQFHAPGVARCWSISTHILTPTNFTGNLIYDECRACAGHPMAQWPTVHASAASNTCRELQVRLAARAFSEIDSGEATVALGELLSRAGCNIITLAIDTPVGETGGARADWVDRLQGETFSCTHAAETY